MIFRLRTSQRTKEIFEDLEQKLNLKPYTLVKHAIAWSLTQPDSVKGLKFDGEGLDLNRQTITGDYDAYFKALIEQHEGCHLSDDDYFPTYIKAHIDRGAPILADRYRHAGNIDEYIKHTLGVGDTV